MFERTGEPNDRIPPPLTGVIFGRTGGPLDVETIGPLRFGLIGGPSEVKTSGCLTGLFIIVGTTDRVFAAGA